MLRTSIALKVLMALTLLIPVGTEAADTTIKELLRIAQIESSLDRLDAYDKLAASFKNKASDDREMLSFRELRQWIVGKTEDDVRRRFGAPNRTGQRWIEYDNLAIYDLEESDIGESEIRKYDASYKGRTVGVHIRWSRNMPTIPDYGTERRHYRAYAFQSK